jgi:predicted transcriptional regulator
VSLFSNQVFNCADGQKSFVTKLRAMVQNQENLDVVQCAGIDEKGEVAQYLSAKKGHTDRRNVEELERKNEWRKMIEERIDQRLLKLAESQGIADVNTNVSAFMENALHARLEQVIKQTTSRARQRAGINRSAFSSYHVESDPRQKVRDLNLRKQAEQDAREDIRKQALLSVARAGDNKRRAPEIPVGALVARKQEDERALAEKANDAARSALGICHTELKWANMAPGKMAKTVAVRADDREIMPPPEPKQPRHARPTYTLLRQDCE